MFCFTWLMIGLVKTEANFGIYDKAAVAAPADPCASIGIDVLKRGGSAVDAAIATLFCSGVKAPQSMGIGGGFVATIYTKSTSTIEGLVSRETAPGWADKDMFKDNPDEAVEGPKSIAVPGEIRGYKMLKDKYGNPNVSWASLIEPTIEICRNGVLVDSKLAKSLQNNAGAIKKDPGLSSIFIDPDTSKPWVESDKFRWHSFADTLERIAKNGADEFYTGDVAKRMRKDITQAGGNITKEDLASFQPLMVDPLMINIDNDLKVYGLPPPISGAVLMQILNILKYYKFTPQSLDEPLTYHRIAEAFKWAYGSRTNLGDPNDSDITEYIDELVANMTSDSFCLDIFNKIDDSRTINNASYYGAEYFTPEDSGTAQISVLDQNGDAVSITSTINSGFGSKFMSPSTGIIMNNEMDDFSYPNITNHFGVPPSPNNFPKPGKRPLSSMTPIIILNATNDAISIVGSAGGTRITTSTALSLIRTLWFRQKLNEAFDAPRLHHQLAPMVLRHRDFDKKTLGFLRLRKHELDEGVSSVLVGIERRDHSILASTDPDIVGGVDGF